MLSRALEHLNLISGELSRSHLVRRRIFAFSFVLLCCVLTLMGVLPWLPIYSPDSWAYYELSKTVFEGEFYRFNTYRSYFSETYSTAFPLGYPVLLAIGQFFLGKSPLVAVAVNVVAAVATWVVIIQLAKRINLSPLAGFALATSLILFPFYLGEVYLGRAIPIALLFFLLALSAYFSRRLFACGLFLGLSVLVRFDYLVYAILLQAAVVIFDYKQSKRLLLLISGFLLGVLPWVLYSESHFGRAWVSDNSWVALSALPAFVDDFPAAATMSAAENPAMWIQRVMGNIVPLIRSIISSSLRFPLLVLLSLFFLYSYRGLINTALRKSIVLFVILAISVAPYLLTGYFESRYFSLLFLCTAGVIAFSIESSSLDQRKAAIYNAAIIISLVLSVLIGGYTIAKQSWAGIVRLNKPDLIKQVIEQLSKCHETEPEVAYIFMGEATLAARYGAMTGNRTAFIPSNFDRMNEVEKERYFNYMKPFVFVANVPEADKCPLSQ